MPIKETDEKTTIKVGIIGCGMIADQHVECIKRIQGCTIQAVCDTEELMAQQLADRFHIPYIFNNVDEMLDKTSISVVHITTPPQSHFSLGRRCLEAGRHVYIEKPFTETVAEAEGLIALAVAKKLKITVGHNLQFTPEAMRMRELIQAGFLGGPPIHIESIQCFSHDEPTYGRTVLGDPNHWVRRLPGSLLHNLISHGVSKIAEFMVGNNPKVLSVSLISPYLKQIGQTDIVDEVRAIIRDEVDTTAFFLFTTQFGAGSNELRLYGKTGTLVLDNTYRMILKKSPSRQKSYMRYFFGPTIQAGEYVGNSIRNIKSFIKKEFHMDYGMRKLMELFYAAIRDDKPEPISHEEILWTARIMEAIFQKLPDCQDRNNELLAQNG
jgi:predicted dehydrogenase